MVLVYYFLAIAILLLLSHRVIDYVFYKEELPSAEKIEANEHAHIIIMEMGEILSRPPTDRYPDMETNQNKVKLYYQRVSVSPIVTGNSAPINNEKVQPILVSVK
jgi:hypothetical protein